MLNIWKGKNNKVQLNINSPGISVQLEGVVVVVVLKSFTLQPYLKKALIRKVTENKSGY